MLAGGLGSLATSGSFINGAANGLMVSTFNHMQQTTSRQFTRRLLNHYRKGNGGDFELTFDEFMYLMNEGRKDFSNSKLQEDGLYKALISFYKSGSDLANSLGTSTFYYQNQNGNVGYAGFYDTYNFDSKSIGARSGIAEIKTRVVSLIKGTEFRIIYNYYK